MNHANTPMGIPFSNTLSVTAKLVESTKARAVNWARNGVTVTTVEQPKRPLGLGSAW